jgi:hypothetical protein
MWRAALFLAVACLLALAAAVALARVGAAPDAQAAAIAAGGDFQISSSREGQPIFAAGAIGPGDSARGTVEIADTGSVPVALTLSRGELLDSPGLGGGLLSGALTLRVTDLTDPSLPVPVYAGPLDSMPDQAAGRLEPGASRTYEFVARLPAGGAGIDQNAVQGASVSVAYSWTATEATEPAAPVVSPPVHGSLRPGAAPLGFAVRRVVGAARGGRILVWTRCDSACSIRVRGRLRASAGHRHRGARVRFVARVRNGAGTQRLSIPVPARLRRWLAVVPGKRRLRAKLTFTATGPSGTAAAVKRTLKLRPPPRPRPRSAPRPPRRGRRLGARPGRSS